MVGKFEKKHKKIKVLHNSADKINGEMLMVAQGSDTGKKIK